MGHSEVVREGRTRKRSGGEREGEREARKRNVESAGGNGSTVGQDQRQTEGSMRPTETNALTPAEEERDERRGRTGRMRTRRREEFDEEATGGGRGEKRCRGTAPEKDDGGMGSGTETQGKESMNVKTSPRRKCTARAENEQKGRRDTGRGTTRRAAERIRYIGSGTGKGKIPLAQAIMVGRVCVVRTARTGEERTDAGWPCLDPG